MLKANLSSEYLSHSEHPLCRITASENSSHYSLSNHASYHQRMKSLLIILVLATFSLQNLFYVYFKIMTGKLLNDKTVFSIIKIMFSQQMSPDRIVQSFLVKKLQDKFVQTTCYYNVNHFFVLNEARSSILLSILKSRHK